MGCWVRIESARLLRRVKKLSTEDLQEILRRKVAPKCVNVLVLLVS